MTVGGIDALTGTYRLYCPATGAAGVRLSSFREIERLAGPAHPAVYRVVFSCRCGDQHVALVGHDELDWAPLGLDEGTTYVNLMTSRREDLSTELSGLATAPDRTGGVAVVLLLPSGGRCAPGHALCVPAARTGPGDGRRGCALPRL